MNKLELMKTANEIRKGIVTALHSAKAGHPGGSLSATEIFTYLYFEEMNVDPKDPKKADRDRFVLSKGHAAPALYATLIRRIRRWRIVTGLCCPKDTRPPDFTLRLQSVDFSRRRILLHCVIQDLICRDIRT